MTEKFLKQFEITVNRLKETFESRLQDLTELSLSTREEVIRNTAQDLERLMASGRELRHKLKDDLMKTVDENNVLRELLGVSDDGLKLKILQLADEQKKLSEEIGRLEDER